MTEVFINQQQVFFKEDTNLKLTIENTFFEEAGSYTLDVVFPLNIEQNRIVFGAINRIDVSKHYLTFDAMIVVDSKLVFKGTARTTSINDSEVRLQLLSGNSRVKFWTKAQKMYIDEFQYVYTDTNSSFEGYAMDDPYGHPVIEAGSFPGQKGVYCYVPVYDENGGNNEQTIWKNGLLNEQILLMNHDEFMAITHGGNPEYRPYYISSLRDSISPNLMFVTRWILNHLGYTIERNEVDNEFINSIYIATARRTTTFKRYDNSNSADEMAMAKALPHWTVEEFIKQLQKFLNVTFIFDDIKGTVDIIRSAYESDIIDLTDNVEEEYEVEMIDDEDVEDNLYDSNVKYKEGSSGYHGTEMIERDTLESFSEVECTFDEFLQQWDEMTDDEKKRTVWTTERGQFCAKITEQNNHEVLEKARFNHFGAIIRNRNNDNEVELKISPVAMTREFKMGVYTYYNNNCFFTSDDYKANCEQVVVCLQNQYASNKATVWEAINGDRFEESEKEDIMQVFLMDDKEVPTGFYHLTYQMPFTHWDHNKPNANVSHKNWSLSLANDDSECYIGQMHEIARRQNRNAEHRFKFILDKIPSVYAVFLIRNKRYACKKLEVRFDANGMDKEIDGYFEELL